MPKLAPRFDWVSEPRLQLILQALRRDGEARFVGGCVRDALLGESPLENDAIDIDIATDRTPDEMLACFEAAGVRAIPTGAAHGTITAVASGLVAECTTLRADVETDGRHAVVAFSRNWDDDWRRRDFTINALYADDRGNVWDPSNGQSDLANGAVRFIGEAGTRIKEDALRILRFFRFSSRFADTFDEAAKDAIRAHGELIRGLSRERIWSELSRTFAAPRSGEALALAQELGVLSHIIPETARTEIFRVYRQAGQCDVAGSLAALWPGLDAKRLREDFRAPNGVIDLYRDIEKAREALSVNMSAHELLYRYRGGAPYLAAQIAVAEGESVDPSLIEALRGGLPPVLPISGKDVVARGIEPGPKISTVMKNFERLWLDAGVPQDPKAIKRLLDAALDH
ncbi:MAG: CCA tRNA nucleotidyltransferase [Pseudomonadota bacterium]